MENLKYDDETPIKEGDYFIALISGDISHRNSPIVSLNLSAESKKIYTSNITFGRLYCDNNGDVEKAEIPLLFKYLGNDEVIELLTKRKMPVMHSKEEYTKLTVFEDYNAYKKVTNNLIVFSLNSVDLIKPNEPLKLAYFNLVTEYGSDIKDRLQKSFDTTQNNFEVTYAETVKNYYYRLAIVDNMMFDLDKKLEDKTKIKVKK